MVVRGKETHRIFLDEIAILLIENPMVSLTGCLVTALIEKKMRIVFCDEKRNPAAELTQYCKNTNAGCLASRSKSVSLA